MSKRSHVRIWTFPMHATLGVVTAIGLLTGTAAATPELSHPLTQDDLSALIEQARILGEKARERAQPLAPGEVKVLQAVIMSVEGRADWRATPDASWKRAEVDDLLSPGALIRTGRDAKVALRVGHNASILVGRRSRVALPQIVQVGDTLTSTTQVQRGRVDVKIDRVGLTNDFTVVTPSTTLAVRGTALRVMYGGLRGTEVTGVASNELRAIEIRYFLSRFAYAMSGAAASTDAHNIPAVSALYDTFGPPHLISGLIENTATPELLDDAFVRNPIVQGRKVDQANQNTMQLDDLFDPGGMYNPLPPPMFLDMFDFGGFGDTSHAGIAEYVCLNLFDVFIRYDDLLVGSFGSPDAPGGLEFPGLNALLLEVNDICQIQGDYTEQELEQIMMRIVDYCQHQFSQQTQVDLCIDHFIQAGGDSFNQPR